MKITPEVLEDICGVTNKKFARHLDLSHCNIVTLEGLKGCYALQTLVLRYNSITFIPKAVSSLTELWKLDLSHNLVSSLEGLSKIRCIGTLILSYNNLSWEELRKIQHVVITDLRLLGNPELEKDPYYRRHVIDCLPHVWMLDGLLVTALERKQVARFFQNSEVVGRPVRRKLRPLTASLFVPTHLKTLSTTPINGKLRVNLMSRFSTSEKQTTETDKRRLAYLTENIEAGCNNADCRYYWKQLQVAGKLHSRSVAPVPGYLAYRFDDMYSLHKELDGAEALQGEVPPPGFGEVPPLIRLMWKRKEDVERCNMLLIVLVSGLEFSLPLILLEDTLRTANLAEINGIDCLALLQLPQSELLLTCSLLMSYVIVDRGEGEEGGLYRRLYISLYIIISNLLRCTHGSPKHYKLKFMSPVVHRALLAAEVVQLMCLVPKFVDMMHSDQGVLDLVAIATQNPYIRDEITKVVWKNQIPEDDKEDHPDEFDEDFTRSVTATILHYVDVSIEENCYEVMDLEEGVVPYHRPPSAVTLATDSAIKQRVKSGLAHRRLRTRNATKEKVPQLGDRVALPRLRKGRIIGLHEQQLALIQISSQPINSVREAFGEYVYVDLQFMKYDPASETWRQQEHVQEYVPHTNIQHVEKCYTVTSKHSDRPSPKVWTYAIDQQQPHNEIGEPYRVHENHQLRLDMSPDAIAYIEERSVKSSNSASRPFAPEGTVSVEVPEAGAVVVGQLPGAVKVEWMSPEAAALKTGTSEGSGTSNDRNTERGLGQQSSVAPPDQSRDTFSRENGDVSREAVKPGIREYVSEDRTRDSTTKQSNVFSDKTEEKDDDTDELNNKLDIDDSKPPPPVAIPGKVDIIEESNEFKADPGKAIVGEKVQLFKDGPGYRKAGTHRLSPVMSQSGRDHVRPKVLDTFLPQPPSRSGHRRVLSHRDSIASIRAPVSSRCSNRPTTRSSIRSEKPQLPGSIPASLDSTHQTYCLFNTQKSLPDVTGISIFSYSAGGIGVMKPPDCTTSNDFFAPRYYTTVSAKKTKY